jgi:peptidyl-prolyl cis-trans isomerase SurA
MATRMRTDAQQFAKALSGSGVSINALRRKLRADLAWNQIVRGKFQNNLIVADKDIAAAVQSRKKDDKAAVEYTLRPILLLVPRGAGDAAIESRRREADALRTRFQNCDDGVKLARGLKDVAVREPLTRSSADLGAKLRELLDGMEIGRLTPPDITPQGVEVFALCAKKQAKGDTGAERDVREELFGERFQAQGKKYLQELRRSAMIETK